MPTRADRLVADTNVPISAALRADTPPRQVLDVVRNAGGALLFCLVTGDRGLLDMHPFRGVPVSDPATFLGDRA